MSTMRIALLACLAGAGLAGVAEAPAAPVSKHSGAFAPRHHAIPSNRGIGRHGGHRSAPGAHWHGGHWNRSHWGWGLGLAIGVPWVLGWHDPWWSLSPYPAYSYSHSYDPGFRHHGYVCEQDEDCWRERLSRSEPAAPTTEVAPAAAGAEGGPTERPLHLNYCDAAKAWFPHVRTCPEGWRLVRPDYRPGS